MSLVLTRKIGEKLIFGDGATKIIVTIGTINRDQVRIEIDAPRHIPVHREEIYNRIKKEKSIEELQREHHNSQSENR